MFSRKLPCWCLSNVPPMGRLKKTVQVSNAVLLAVCNREKVSVVNHTDAFTARSGAPRKHLYRDQLHPVTVARAGWCSTSSLLQVPSVARFITTCQALALNKDKTRHSPSNDRKESSNTMQPDLRCWDQCHPVLSLMHNITGLLTGTPASTREQQHHSSVKRTFSVLPFMSNVTPL